MNNKALNHNASDKLNQPLAVWTKTKTVVWVQSKVSKKWQILTDSRNKSSP